MVSAILQSTVTIVNRKKDLCLRKIRQVAFQVGTMLGRTATHRGDREKQR